MWVEHQTQEGLFRQAMNLELLLQDSQASADRVGRWIDAIEPLALRIKVQAEMFCRGRWQIRNSAQAIILLGLDRVRRILNLFLDELCPQENPARYALI